MNERFWFIFLGVLISFFEILIGAAAGLDIAFIGISFIIGGIFFYIGAGWQLSLAISVSAMIVYFLFLRTLVRKPILLFMQRFGIDVLVGKYGVLIVQNKKKESGYVVVDGDVWKAQTAQGEVILNEAVVEIIGLNGKYLKVKKMNLT